MEGVEPNATQRNVLTRAAHKDFFWWAALSCGPVFWCLLWLSGERVTLFEHRSEHWLGLLMVMAVYPVLEEVVFRGGLQPWVYARITKVAFYGLTLANVLTSVVFAAMHMFYHAPMWAAAVFFPSLVFGFFMDRHQRLFSPIVLHIFYNSGYALLFMSF